MSVQYLSTRGQAPTLDFEGVLLAGLARDGGLYLPEALPTFSAAELQSMRGMSYPELATTVIAPFVEGSIDRETLAHLVEASYRDFRHQAVAPLVQLDQDQWLLELFHGPTLAFKDFALQLLGRLLDHVLTRRGEKVVIMGATSGDTGSAAIEGCRHGDQLDVFILHPHERVSEVQRRQMTTVKGANIFNIAIEGNFDQAQDMLFEYGSVADERESLKSYNDYVAGLVADQQKTLDAIQADINGVDKLRQGVVPLMFKMVEALDQFVNLDLPFNTQVRKERVENLKNILNTAEVTLAEKYRLILDAYSIEREYGNFVAVHTGKLDLDGKEVLVDFFNLGRVALYAQSLDQKTAWMYDADAKTWNKLDDSYLRDITKGIRIARKQGALDLFGLPIPAAETAQ